MPIEFSFIIESAPPPPPPPPPPIGEDRVIIGMCATSLVTHGMISCVYTQLSSCRKPSVTTVVEVRPRIRRVDVQQDVAEVKKPVVVASLDLKPTMISGRAASEPAAAKPPTNVSTQELKPQIVKIREDEE